MAKPSMAKLRYLRLLDFGDLWSNMLLPNCLLLSTLIYKKTACLTTNSSVLSVLKSNSIILSDNRAERGGPFFTIFVPYWTSNCYIIIE